MVLLGRLCNTWREDRLEVEEMAMDTRGSTSWELRISPSNLHISVIIVSKIESLYGNLEYLVY